MFGHSGGYRSRDVREERVIGVDLGGTKILAGLVGRDGAIGRTIEIPTPDGAQEQVLAAIDGVVEDLLGDGAAAIGYGVPLNIDRRTGVALRATNLPLHECTSRIARESATVFRPASRTTGTLRRSPSGDSGQEGALGPDHADPRHRCRRWSRHRRPPLPRLGRARPRGRRRGRPPCQGNCHGRGHLEAHASGLAADRAAAEIYGPSADAPVLVTRARSGERRAIEALREIGRLLGAAIGSLVNIFDPDIVIVGGGFGAAAADLVLEPARLAARADAIQPADETLRIVEAELGDEAGLIGAALVAFEALDGVR